MTLKRHFLLISLLFVTFSTFAQRSSKKSTPVTTDPQAVSLVSASLAALSGSTAITDVTLTGTAARIAGSDTETGTAAVSTRGDRIGPETAQAVIWPSRAKYVFDVDLH
jgi:hypothetical protein